MDEPDDDLDRAFFSPYPPPDSSLVGKRSEIERVNRKAVQEGLPSPNPGLPPNWPPVGWKRDEFPKDTLVSAALAWIRFQQDLIDTMLQWAGGQGVASEHQRVLPEILNDLALLVRHFMRLGVSGAPVVANHWESPHQARVGLLAVEQWLAGLIKIPGPGQAEESSVWWFRVAVDVRGIIRSPGGMDRFREMVRAWATEVTGYNAIASHASMEGVMDERIPYSDGVKLIPIPSRKVSLAEKYAILAALHDECCKGELVNPWGDSEFPPLREANRYTALCCSFYQPQPAGAKDTYKLTIPYADEYLFREFVADVKFDIERCMLPNSEKSADLRDRADAVEQEQTIGLQNGGTKNEPAPIAVKPRWDKERRELWWGGMMCKKYRQTAPNQTRLLNEFEDLGWPNKLEDPLPGNANVDRRDRLADTIRRLNENSYVFFELDGTGEAVLWRPKGTDQAPVERP